MLASSIARGSVAAWLLLCALSSAHADPVVLRFASVAPEGTAWAHELRRIGRDVERATDGVVKLKWYFGGIAGDDVQTGERMAKGQLDGVASGGHLCTRLAPAMRVLRVLGLFQNRAEAAYVMARLKPELDKQFLDHGFVNLAEVGLGADVLFSREPLRSLDELRHTKLWIWDLDEVMRLQLPRIGAAVVPLSLNDAGRAYDEHRIDALMALPTAALAFQWSAQVHYVSDLYMGFLSGCLVMTSRSFDALPNTARIALGDAAAKLQRRVEDMGAYQDEQIMKGLFTHQGLKPVHVDATFKANFFDAARAAREQLGTQLVDTDTLAHVQMMLADYRAEHRD